MSEQLKCIYWAGWMSSKAMSGEEYTPPSLGTWLETWTESARKAEANNSQLVVFRIPVTPPHQADPALIEEIERLIQKKYGTTR